MGTLYTRTKLKEHVSPDQVHWHAILDGLDEYKIKRLVVEFES